MKNLFAWIKEIVVTFVIAALLALLIKNFVLDMRYIPSSSMYPTIYIGDRVIVNRFLYYFYEPERGDVVVFKPPVFLDAEEDYIKRLIALPGETVEIKDGSVFINGALLKEDYLHEPPNYQFGPEVVPEDMYFFLGDNRNESYDGHAWPYPFVAKRNILGKAFMRYWPLQRFAIWEDENYENITD